MCILEASGVEDNLIMLPTQESIRNNKQETCCAGAGAQFYDFGAKFITRPSTEGLPATLFRPSAHVLDHRTRSPSTMIALL